MVITREKFQLPKTTVVAPPQRRYNMRQPQFYEQQVQPVQEQKLEPSPDFESIRIHGTQVPSEEELPTSEEHIRSGIQALQSQALIRPEIQPGERVRSPSAELVQPSQFRTFYENLQTIGRIGQARVGAEQQRAQHRELERLKDIMSQQVPAFGGVQLRGMGNYNQNLIAKSAPLRMLGRGIQPYARSAAQEISGKFGISNIGGHATSGHIRGSDHYTGNAIDVMGGKGGVVRYALQNAGRLGVKYIIHNRKYWEPGRAPVRYTGSNPHTGHVHISFHSGGGASGGGYGGGGASGGGAKGIVRNIAAKQYGWSGKEWQALHTLVQKESSWNPGAANPRSSARGLFQKMTSLHGPIERGAAGQARWGLNYIRRRYGSPSRALAFHRRNNWY